MNFSPLKEILYCPTATSLQLRKFVVGEPAQLKAATRENRFHFVEPKMNSEKIPSFFTRQIGFGDYAWGDFAPKMLEASLQYHFENGDVLTASEIFLDARCRRLPMELLPLNQEATPEGESFEVGAHSIIEQSPKFDVDDYYEAERAVLQVLLNAMKMKVPVRLADSHLRSQNRVTLPIKKISIVPMSETRWRLNCAPELDSEVRRNRSETLATLELEPKQALQDLKIAVADNFLLGAESGELQLVPFISVLKGVDEKLIPQGAQLLEIDGRLPISYYPQQKEPRLRRKLLLPGQDLIQATLAMLMRAQENGGLPEVSIEPKSEILQREDYRTVVDVHRSGTLRLSHENLNKKFSHWSLPACQILLTLQNGLQAMSSVPSVDLAHKARGPRRERDLRILRHQGLVQFLFIEAASYALFGENMMGEKVKSRKAFDEWLLQKTPYLVFGDAAGVSINSLEDLCSKRILTLFKDFVQFVIDNTKSGNVEVFGTKGVYQLNRGVDREMRLLHTLVKAHIEGSQGKSLLKARSKLAGDEKVPEVSLGESSMPSLDLTDSFGSGIVNAILPLAAQGFQIRIEGMNVEEIEENDFKPQFEIKEASGVSTRDGRLDWFELDPQFFFKGQLISLREASQFAREGLIEFNGKLYLVPKKHLPKYRVLERFWSQLAEGKKEGRFKQESRYFKLSRSQTLDILALRASGVEVRGGEKWQEICRFFDALSQPRDDWMAPSTVVGQLKPYQNVGVQWIEDIYKLGLGGILADDMGLGKTLQALTFLESLRVKGQLGNALIVVPTSLTYNWRSEASRFVPQLPVHVFDSSASERMRDFVLGHSGGVVIVTYGLLRRHLATFAQIEWQVHIYDEAQNLKNITTQTTTDVRKLPARFKLCLTGTPMENHYSELFSLIDLTVPGALGELRFFQARYVRPPTVPYEDIQSLKLKVKPLVMRRTKSEILQDLPEKSESEILLEFSEKQRKLYRDIALSWNHQVSEVLREQGEAKSQILMLTALLRLRQACSDPATLPNVKYSEVPPKLERIVESLAEVTESGESALVFTQFLGTLEHAYRLLLEAKIPCYVLHGSMSRPDREKTLSEFQNFGGGAVMLMTLKTGGVGLNLTKASYVFHLEPWWNPAVENQATDRTHRLGQTRKVNVFRYIMKDSVEEKIQILKARKDSRFQALFGQEETAEEGLKGNRASLSREDFEYLLSE